MHLLTLQCLLVARKHEYRFRIPRRIRNAKPGAFQVGAADLCGESGVVQLLTWWPSQSNTYGGERRHTRTAAAILVIIMVLEYPRKLQHLECRNARQRLPLAPNKLIIAHVLKLPGLRCLSSIVLSARHQTGCNQEREIVVVGWMSFLVLRTAR